MTTLCRATRSRGSLYLDGRLSVAARRQVQEHLRTCPGCLAEYRALLALAQGCRELPRTAAPPDLARRVRAEAARRRSRAVEQLGRSPRPRARRIAAAVALWVALPLAAGLAGYALGCSRAVPPTAPTAGDDRRAVATDRDAARPTRSLAPRAPDDATPTAPPPENGLLSAPGSVQPASVGTGDGTRVVRPAATDPVDRRR